MINAPSNTSLACMTEKAVIYKKNSVIVVIVLCFPPLKTEEVILCGFILT